MEKKKKKYVKPETVVIKIDSDKKTLTTSGEQCDCYEYREHIGCIGCKGGCGCNHWDRDLQEIVPGC